MSIVFEFFFICVPFACLVPKEAKRGRQILCPGTGVVTCHVGTENPTVVFRKGSHCF